jgi:hypothetical protein
MPAFRGRKKGRLNDPVHLPAPDRASFHPTPPPLPEITSLPQGGLFAQIFTPPPRRALSPVFTRPPRARQDGLFPRFSLAHPEPAPPKDIAVEKLDTWLQNPWSQMTSIDSQPFN